MIELGRRRAPNLVGSSRPMMDEPPRNATPTASQAPGPLPIVGPLRHTAAPVAAGVVITCASASHTLRAVPSGRGSSSLAGRRHATRMRAAALNLRCGRRNRRPRRPRSPSLVWVRLQGGPAARPHRRPDGHSADEHRGQHDRKPRHRSLPGGALRGSAHMLRTHSRSGLLGGEGEPSRTGCPSTDVTRHRTV